MTVTSICSRCIFQSLNMRIVDIGISFSLGTERLSSDRAEKVFRWYYYHPRQVTRNLCLTCLIEIDIHGWVGYLEELGAGDFLAEEQEVTLYYRASAQPCTSNLHGQYRLCVYGGAMRFFFYIIIKRPARAILSSDIWWMVISIHQSLNTGSDGIVHLGVDIRRTQVLLASACHRDQC